MSELTLGITRIGDLLKGEKITRKIPENTEITPVSLIIPDYQRPYKWKVKNAIRLLDDIEEARRSNKEVYRVGTLILHKKEIKSKNGKDENGQNKGSKIYEYNIVDGQQRVITFSLLLKCLLEETKTQAEPQTETQSAMKIGIAFFDQSLKDNPHTRWIGNLDTKRNVCQNYQAFKRRLASLEKGSKIELRNYIEKQCELVVIITDDVSEAFQFFDSQNARGKKLYPHDLLKAYHLREMRDCPENEINHSVEMWESINQGELAGLFENLYRLKKWIMGEIPTELSEKNLDIFKGIKIQDNYPYTNYHIIVYDYIDRANSSYIPLITGIPAIRLFQINAPVIAGKPFFEYTKHYYDLLYDIHKNDIGRFVKDNDIVKVIDNKNTGLPGDRFTRTLFDAAILLYVDRFCHMYSHDEELDDLKQFIKYAFIWAYSMRIQYQRLQWDWALNYVNSNKKKNSFNLYKIITANPSPKSLFSELEEKLNPVLFSKGKDPNSDITLKEDDFKKWSNFQSGENKCETIAEWFVKLGYLKPVSQ